jgi:hypothetical protein
LSLFQLSVSFPTQKGLPTGFAHYRLLWLLLKACFCSIALWAEQRPTFRLDLPGGPEVVAGIAEDSAKNCLVIVSVGKICYFSGQKTGRLS